MTFSLQAIAVTAAFAVSTGLTLYLAGSQLLLDRPNERSLHKIPVPRTGGIAVLAGIRPIVFGESRTVIQLEEQTLMALDREFNDATAAHGGEGWASYFAEGGKMFPGPETVDGPAAIRELMTPVFADSNYSLTWEPVGAEVALARDLGYTYGRYESIRRLPHGRRVVGRGWYFTTWRKQSDGTWRIVADIGSPDGPPDTLTVETP